MYRTYPFATTTFFALVFTQNIQDLEFININVGFDSLLSRLREFSNVVHQATFNANDSGGNSISCCFWL
jgi:hypothetical protein